MEIAGAPILEAPLDIHLTRTRISTATVEVEINTLVVRFVSRVQTKKWHKIQMKIALPLHILHFRTDSRDIYNFPLDIF